MKSLNIFIAPVIIGLAMCAGCKDHLNREFDYNDISENCNSGLLSVRLLGTYTSDKKTTTKGSPYEILVSFKSKIDAEGQVTIKKFNLYHAKSKKLVYSLPEPQAQNLIVDSGGSYTAYFNLAKIELDFENYFADIELDAKIADKEVHEEVNVKFEKNYKERESNSFWEKLMGV